MPRFPTFLLASVFLGAPVALHAQLAFSFDYEEGMSGEALRGFQAAGARWSAVFKDPITVRLNLGYRNLGTGSLASVDTTQRLVRYRDFTAALRADRSSRHDVAAAASLPDDASFQVWLNRTAGHAAEPYTASDDSLLVPLANARALGLYRSAGGAVDGSITFNSSFEFDFDGSDGIAAGAFDFVGIATHEIGHALGFFSGVDELDANPGLHESAVYQTPLDLFRYSLESAELGLIDGTADAREKFFSIDGGRTALAAFSTGVTFGDGRQASHWKDHGGIGLMDPTAARGELLHLRALDRMAFDVIGYDLAAVPEPADIALWGVAMAGLAILLRQRRQRGGR